MENLGILITVICLLPIAFLISNKLFKLMWDEPFEKPDNTIWKEHQKMLQDKFPTLYDDNGKLIE